MRTSGILLHISSLPSKYGIGTIGEEAKRFIDFLAETKQTYWQVLPVGHTSFGDSPYQTFSAFAGNPYFIDLDYLIDLKLLKKSEIINEVSDNKFVDYGVLYINRYKVLRKAFSRFVCNPDYNLFCEENKSWLEDYSLFMAVKDYYQGKSWSKWPDNIKKRDSKAIFEYHELLLNDVNFYKFIQYIFYKEWKELKKYANENSIKIIGDLPIYVAYDSSDCWSNPSLFDLDIDLTPNHIAGVPPDSFSEVGQLWGNPLYNWDVMKKDGYKWWLERLNKSHQLFDITRVDHFIGFLNYYNIKKGAIDGKDGFYLKGPGIDFFNTIKKKMSNLNIIAEDLGLLTSDVVDLISECGFPGMEVLQFAFNSKEDGKYLPHNHISNSVVYTGTHDNKTTKSWFLDLNDDDKTFCLTYLHSNKKNIVDDMIKAALGSVSKIAIIPMQDYLNLDDSARMNIPGTVGSNWRWRMMKSDLSISLKKKIKSLCETYRRTRNFN